MLRIKMGSWSEVGSTSPSMRGIHFCDNEESGITDDDVQRGYFLGFEKSGVEFWICSKSPPNNNI